MVWSFQTKLYLVINAILNYETKIIQSNTHWYCNMKLKYFIYYFKTCLTINFSIRLWQSSGIFIIKAHIWLQFVSFSNCWMTLIVISYTFIVVSPLVINFKSTWIKNYTSFSKLVPLKCVESFLIIISCNGDYGTST